MFDLILKNNPKIIIKRFIYQVKISKTKYLKMIDNRYISTLLNFTDNEIIYGSSEVMRKYKKILKFDIILINYYYLLLIVINKLLLFYLLLI